MRTFFISFISFRIDILQASENQQVYMIYGGPKNNAPTYIYDPYQQVFTVPNAFLNPVFPNYQVYPSQNQQNDNLHQSFIPNQYFQVANCPACSSLKNTHETKTPIYQLPHPNSYSAENQQHNIGPHSSPAYQVFVQPATIKNFLNRNNSLATFSQNNYANALTSTETPGNDSVEIYSCDSTSPETVHEINNHNTDDSENVSTKNEIKIINLQPSLTIKTTKRLHIEKITAKIKKELRNLWINHTKNEINTVEPGLLDFLNDCDTIKKWDILDENSEMFIRDKKESIDFHIPVNFENITIYRKKYFYGTKEFTYQYLVVKGEDTKKIKNLDWKGNKIFIMDCSNIGKNVTLYEYAYIGPGCKIGDNSCISNFCFLKRNVEIGEKTRIYINNYFGEGSKIGAQPLECDYFDDEDVFSSCENEIKPKNLKTTIYNTILSNSNYIGDNVVLRQGLFYEGKLSYYLK